MITCQPTMNFKHILSYFPLSASKMFSLKTQIPKEPSQKNMLGSPNTQAICYSDHQVL